MQIENLGVNIGIENFNKISGICHKSKVKFFIAVKTLELPSLLGYPTIPCCQYYITCL